MKNFTKFLRKIWCHWLFYSEVTGFRPAKFVQDGLLHNCFPVNLTTFFIANFLCEQLLLKQSHTRIPSDMIWHHMIDMMEWFATIVKRYLLDVCRSPPFVSVHIFVYQSNHPNVFSWRKYIPILFLVGEI